MKFSKEYINECDCPEIQGLRKELKLYDFYTFEYGDDLYPTISICVDETLKYKGFIWLPTSGQLDEEIVKILKEWSKDGENLNYEIGLSFAEGIESSYQVSVSNRDAAHEELDDNPLIAKIKLLKELLKESGE